MKYNFWRNKWAGLSGNQVFGRFSPHDWKSVFFQPKTWCVHTPNDLVLWQSSIINAYKINLIKQLIIVPITEYRVTVPLTGWWFQPPVSTRENKICSKSLTVEIYQNHQPVNHISSIYVCLHLSMRVWRATSPRRAAEAPQPLAASPAVAARVRHLRRDRWYQWAAGIIIGF